MAQLRAFSPETRAALAFTDAIVEGGVPTQINDDLALHFDLAQRVELTVTAAFYSMVPRVLEALSVPVEDEEPPPRPPEHRSIGSDASDAASTRLTAPASAPAHRQPGRPPGALSD